MPEYRRNYVSGGTYFFTLVTHLRRHFLVDELARPFLRRAIDTVRSELPFDIVAMVLLPDHLHAIWTLPDGDENYSLRWKRIKGEFTTSYLDAGGCQGPVSASRRKRGERGIWQRRFWEHTVRDETDFERLFDYTHFNPVQHGYVKCPHEWQYSTFHRHVRGSVYPEDWGCPNFRSNNLNFEFSAIQEFTGE